MKDTDQFAPLPLPVKSELVPFVPQNAKWKRTRDQFKPNTLTPGISQNKSPLIKENVSSSYVD